MTSEGQVYGQPYLPQAQECGEQKGFGWWVVVPKSLVPNSDIGQHGMLRGGTGRGYLPRRHSQRPLGSGNGRRTRTVHSSAPRTTPDLGWVSLSSLTHKEETKAQKTGSFD